MNMQIKDLSRRTNLSGKTIRYYEEIGILPSPRRLPNGYRDYDEGDVERVKFVVGARNLDFSLDDIDEILALRDKREAPCRVVLDMIQHRAEEISQRIVELQKLEDDLRELHKLGQTFPMDDVDGKNCVCHLVSERATRDS
jgi:DNA-binding transcriptional MerR regulator